MVLQDYKIEVEEGDTECEKCPFALMDKNGLIVNCIGTKHSYCINYNLATIKIKKLEEEK